MSWILDVSIVLLFIIAILIGMKRGFIGSVAKLMGGFIRLVVSILLAKPFTKLIALTNIDEQMFDNLSIRFSEYSPKFNVNLVGMDDATLSNFVGDALSDAKIPKLFRGFFRDVFSVDAQTLASHESITLADLMGVAVGNIILLVISFVLIFVLLWIIQKIIIIKSKKSVKADNVFAKTNKWLGGLFGFVKVLIFMFIGFLIVDLLSNFSFMHSVVEFINSSFIGKFFYKISQALIDSSFDIKKLVQNWINK